VEEVQLEVHQEVKEREDLAVVEMRVALMEFQEFQEHLIQAGVEVELLMLVVQVQKIYPQVEQVDQE
jgi:hypothetical protein